MNQTAHISLLVSKTVKQNHNKRQYHTGQHQYRRNPCNLVSHHDSQNNNRPPFQPTSNVPAAGEALSRESTFPTQQENDKEGEKTSLARISGLFDPDQGVKRKVL